MYVLTYILSLRYFAYKRRVACGKDVIAFNEADSSSDPNINFDWSVSTNCGCKWGVSSSIWAQFKSHLRRIVRGIGPLRMLDRNWPEATWLFPLLFSRTPPPPVLFPVLFFVPPPPPPYFDPVFFSPYFFHRTFFPVLFFPYFLPRINFPTSVSCFSSTYRYNTVHVPCGISIQTSPVGLPLDGWGAHMRDLKGQKMNFFKQKRIEMFYSTNQSYHWKLNQS